jgi:hypothetical protein
MSTAAPEGRRQDGARHGPPSAVRCPLRRRPGPARPARGNFPTSGIIQRARGRSADTRKTAGTPGLQLCFTEDVMDIQEITQQVEKEIVVVRRIRAEIEKVVVGQRELIDRMLIGLLCDGHILIEGLPGLAKTTAVKTLAATIRTSFQRIQFTPDLLPADILGTQIYRPDTASFEIKKGPIFHNIILADEINRAPAKVQSALLEAMQEQQVTIGQQTFPLGKPFLVLATQNPIEHEGTYPLPEAQIDRFMMKIKVGYPSAEEEKKIMARVYEGAADQVAGVVEFEQVAAASGCVTSSTWSRSPTQRSSRPCAAPSNGSMSIRTSSVTS